MKQRSASFSHFGLLTLHADTAGEGKFAVGCRRDHWCCKWVTGGRRANGTTRFLNHAEQRLLLEVDSAESIVGLQAIIQHENPAMVQTDIMPSFPQDLRWDLVVLIVFSEAAMNLISINTRNGTTVGVVLPFEDGTWEVLNSRDQGCEGYLVGTRVEFSSGEPAGRIEGGSILDSEGDLVAEYDKDSIRSIDGEIVATLDTPSNIDAFCAGVLLLSLNKWYLPSGERNPEFLP